MKLTPEQAREAAQILRLLSGSTSLGPSKRTACEIGAAALEAFEGGPIAGEEAGMSAAERLRAFADSEPLTGPEVAADIRTVLAACEAAEALMAMDASISPEMFEAWDNCDKALRDAGFGGPHA